MSATPRETLKHIRIDVKNGWGFSVAYCQKCQDENLDILHADFCPAPAFAALLAVARHADDHRTDACTNPHAALDNALFHLDTAHPGWREWKS